MNILGADYQRKKELLNSFSEIESRICELENELKSIWNSAINTTQDINGMPKSTNTSNKIVNSIERMEATEVLIKEELNKLKSVNLKIRAAIAELPNITERRIIYLKYIGNVEGKYHRTVPLWKIANKLGYSYDWIKYLHRDAIERLKI